MRNKKNISPSVRCVIGQVQYIGILDTGAQVSCIAEKAYNKIRAMNGIMELPVAGVKIIGPIMKKSVKVTKQCAVTLYVGDYTHEIILLVVPHLAAEIILGNDWLTKNKVIINYAEKSIRIKEKILKSEHVLFDENIEEIGE